MSNRILRPSAHLQFDCPAINLWSHFPQWDYWDDRQRNTVRRSLDALEKDSASFDPECCDLAQITTACGVGWIEFRRDILGIGFRDGRPRLSDWFDVFSKRPSMQNSMPKTHN